LAPGSDNMRRIIIKRCAHHDACAHHHNISEGYLEIIRHIAEQYGAMSLIEFDGYFEGKFEPTKYMQVEVHVNDAKEDGLIEFANKIRIMLKQKSLAFEFNNRLILVEET
jgi:hypothetical protein